MGRVRITAVVPIATAPDTNSAAGPAKIGSALIVRTSEMRPLVWHSESHCDSSSSRAPLRKQLSSSFIVRSGNGLTIGGPKLSSRTPWTYKRSSRNLAENRFSDAALPRRVRRCAPGEEWAPEIDFVAFHCERDTECLDYEKSPSTHRRCGRWCALHVRRMTETRIRDLTGPAEPEILP